MTPVVWELEECPPNTMSFLIRRLSASEMSVIGNVYEYLWAINQTVGPTLLRVLYVAVHRQSVLVVEVFRFYCPSWNVPTELGDPIRKCYCPALSAVQTNSVSRRVPWSRSKQLERESNTEYDVFSWHIS